MGGGGYHVDLVAGHADRGAGGLEDGLRDIARLGELLEGAEALVREEVLVLDEEDALHVGLVVGDDLGKLGEMPRVPLLDTHREEVEVLLHLGDERC